MKGKDYLLQQFMQYSPRWLSLSVLSDDSWERRNLTMLHVVVDQEGGLCSQNKYDPCFKSALGMFAKLGKRWLDSSSSLSDARTGAEIEAHMLGVRVWVRALGMVLRDAGTISSASEVTLQKWNYFFKDVIETIPSQALQRPHDALLGGLLEWLHFETAPPMQRAAEFLAERERRMLRLKAYPLERSKGAPPANHIDAVHTFATLFAEWQQLLGAHADAGEQKATGPPLTLAAEMLVECLDIYFSCLKPQLPR